MKTGWKALTHDFRPPIQGGEPLFDGTYPFTLPKVPLDTSESECGRKGGWHYCHEIETCLKIAGFWRTGRPNAIVLVEPSTDAIERGDKLRASSLTFLRHATPEEIKAAIFRFSAPFGEHREAMTEEQWLWWVALARPERNRDAVISGLNAALEARGLEWSLKEYPNQQAARDAWDAWDARAAWDAWDAWDARAAWDAWDARDALSVQFAARSGWISHKRDKFTVGIRDAYRSGLAVALPTGPSELGWAMEL